MKRGDQTDLYMCSAEMIAEQRPHIFDACILLTLVFILFKRGNKNTLVFLQMT